MVGPRELSCSPSSSTHSLRPRASFLSDQCLSLLLCIMLGVVSLSIYSFIHLAASSLSCGTQHLRWVMLDLHRGAQTLWLWLLGLVALWHVRS